MKTFLVLIGITCIVGGVLGASFSRNRWVQFYSGMLSMVGALFTIATPMPEGHTFRIENGRPVNVMER